MRCSTIEKLLPLHVEGDIQEDEASKVRAHLSSCGMCRRVAEEFRASQSMVHAFEAPEFDEEFYEQIRATVLTGITAREPASRSFFETLRPFFLKRPIVATACLLFLFFGALYGLIYRRPSNNSSYMVAVERGLGEINPARFASATDNRNAAPAPVSALVESNVHTLSIYPRGASGRRKILPGSQSNERREELTSKNNAAASVSTAQAAAGNTGATDTTSTQAIARMEIQTSDPNIRIIWLGRKPSE